MHWSQLPLKDQMFTHLDDKTGAETNFAVSALRRFCNEFPTHVICGRVPLDEATSVMIMKHRGIERPRLRRAQKTKQFQPLLFVFMPDKTHLLVDGSHSYVAMWMRGIRQADAYIVEEPIWQHFLIEGLPPAPSKEALLKSYSGILT